MHRSVARKQVDISVGVGVVVVVVEVAVEVAWEEEVVDNRWERTMVHRLSLVGEVVASSLVAHSSLDHTWGDRIAYTLENRWEEEVVQAEGEGWGARACSVDGEPSVRGVVDGHMEVGTWAGLTKRKKSTRQLKAGTHHCNSNERSLTLFSHRKVETLN